MLPNSDIFANDWSLEVEKGNNGLKLFYFWCFKDSITDKQTNERTDIAYSRVTLKSENLGQKNFQKKLSV